MASLRNYRMLDLSRLLQGPFASHILADMGVEVIKVEEPLPRYGTGRDIFTPPDPETRAWTVSIDFSRLILQFLALVVVTGVFLGLASKGAAGVK